MTEQEVFTLTWHICATAVEVKSIIPDYEQDGDGPYMIVFMGDKGTMVWNYMIMMDIYTAYKSVLDGTAAAAITPSA